MADPGFVSLIPSQPHTCVEIEIISIGIFKTPADSLRANVSHRQKYVH